MTAPADYVLELPREVADLTLYRGRQPGTLNRAVSFSVWSRGAKPRFHRHHRDHDRRLTTYMRRCRVGVRSVYHALRGSRWKIR